MEREKDRLGNGCLSCVRTGCVDAVRAVFCSHVDGFPSSVPRARTDLRGGRDPVGFPMPPAAAVQAHASLPSAGLFPACLGTPSSDT